MKVMDNFYNYFLYKYHNQDFVRFSQAKLTLQFCIVTALFSLLYVFIAIFIDFTQSIVVMSVMAWLFVALSFTLRSGVNLKTIAHLYLFLSFTAALILILYTGKMYSSLVPWLAFIPLSANLLIDKKTSVYWLLITFIAVILLAYITGTISSVEVSYNKQYELLFYALVYNGLSAIILVLSMVFQSAKETYLNMLKEKNDIISTINKELKNKNDEITVQNEELIQQREEILVQREFIEIKNRELLIAQDELNDIIDKLTRTQLNLANREAENRSILDVMYGSQLMVSEIDTEARFIKVSKETQQFLQLPAAEILGKRFVDLPCIQHLELVDGEDFSSHWQGILSGNHLTHEVQIMCNNQLYHHKENFFPILDNTGKTKMVMLVSQDISQLKRKNLEIEELNDTLKEKILEIEKQNIVLVDQRNEIALINEELQKSNEEISNINQNLEQHVQERTKSLQSQNKQLAEYAYINAHLLRGPLCSILGLVNILETELHTDGHPVVFHMKKSTGELHEVVNKITKAIEKGSHFDRSLLHPS